MIWIMVEAKRKVQICTYQTMYAISDGARRVEARVGGPE